MYETVILVSAQLCSQYLILCDLIPPQSAVSEHTPRSFSRSQNRTGCKPKLKPGPLRLRRMKLQAIHNCVNTNSFIRCNSILHNQHPHPGTFPRTHPHSPRPTIARWSGCTPKLNPGPHKKKKTTPRYETIYALHNCVTSNSFYAILFLTRARSRSTLLLEKPEQDRMYTKTETGSTQTPTYETTALHNCVNTNSFIQCNPIPHPHLPRAHSYCLTNQN